MARELEVRRLLERILESHLRPEEVCHGDPDLLVRVRERLRHLRRVEAQVEALLPSAPSTDPGLSPPLACAAEWPEFPQYEVQDVLGRGGMGIVYRAWDRRLNRPVALKMLLAGALALPEEIERFRRGAEAEAALRHANIVHVYDIGELDGRPYFTMEFVEGGSLAQKLAAGPLPAGQAAGLLLTLAQAVQAAHEHGIVHRDLKPANILLIADGTPKITDFGLARRLETGERLTLSGAVLGTPSYMAPEQARGETQATGTAADVYALGAILYETLTGGPPFRAKTTAETIRQVLEEEPTPPSRWHSNVPRDLEVICLKCLQKEPHRRYPSAAALAQDLQRFRRGEPIMARPPGPPEKLARWLKRWGKQVALFSVGTLLGIGLVAAGMWLRSERLERARREHALAERANALHLRRAALAEGRFNPRAERRFNNARADREYEAAFLEAGLGTPGDAPGGVAARVASSVERDQLLAALDDWAVCAQDERRRAWTLEVARRADPDPWRNRIREPATWGSRGALADLARSAPAGTQPGPFMAALGERLHELGADGAAVLERVHQVNPDDFRIALTLARALQEGTNPDAASGPYQVALRLRPDAPAVLSNLGLLPSTLRNWDEARGYHDRALEIDPRFAPAHNNLGLTWKGQGNWPEAIRHFREAIRSDPELAPARSNLGDILAYQGELPEAIVQYRRALQIDPEFAHVEFMLGVALVGKGRLEQAHDRYQRAIRLDPVDAKAHDRIYGRALDDGIEHYQRALMIDPGFAFSRNHLGLARREVEALEEAIGHYEKALRLDPSLDNVIARLGQALLALGRFREAEAATRRCLDRLPVGHELRSNVSAQLLRCEQLIALQGRLPAVLKGDAAPANRSETRQFAELCGILGRDLAAARLYAEALDGPPELNADLRAPDRYRAACAAARVGCAEDAETLTRADQARWRERARDWLRADAALWSRTLDAGPYEDRVLVRRRLSHLWADPDLDGLLHEPSTETLPAVEREECRALWHEIDGLIAQAQGID